MLVCHTDTACLCSLASGLCWTCWGRMEWPSAQVARFSETVAAAAATAAFLLGKRNPRCLKVAMPQSAVQMVCLQQAGAADAMLWATVTQLRSTFSHCMSALMTYFDSAAGSRAGCLMQDDKKVAGWMLMLIGITS